MITIATPQHHQISAAVRAQCDSVLSDLISVPRCLFPACAEVRPHCVAAQLAVTTVRAFLAERAQDATSSYADLLKAQAELESFAAAAKDMGFD